MIGILFKGEIIKPAHAVTGFPIDVDTKCVENYMFVVYESSIVQFWGGGKNPTPRSCFP